MTEEKMERVAEEVFTEARRGYVGLSWGPLPRSTKDSWVCLVKAVVAKLDGGMTPDEITKQYNGVHLKDSLIAVPIVVAAYLLTPRKTP